MDFQFRAHDVSPVALAMFGLPFTKGHFSKGQAKSEGTTARARTSLRRWTRDKLCDAPAAGANRLSDARPLMARDRPTPTPGSTVARPVGTRPSREHHEAGPGEPDPSLLHFPDVGGRMCTSARPRAFSRQGEVDYLHMWGAGIGFNLHQQPSRWWCDSKRLIAHSEPSRQWSRVRGPRGRG